MELTGDVDAQLVMVDLEASNIIVTTVCVVYIFDTHTLTDVVLAGEVGCLI